MKVRELIQDLLKYDMDVDVEIIDELNEFNKLDYVSFNKVQNVVQINILSPEDIRIWKP